MQGYKVIKPRSLFLYKMGNDTGITAYESLGADINKQKGETAPETKQGVVSDKLPELTLEMADEEIIKLTTKWEKSWKDSAKKAEWEKQIEENEKYWLGQQFDKPQADKSRAMVDNLIFESLETFLPQATRRNPEPLVTLDATIDTTPQYEAFVQKTKNRLADLADKNKIRLKLKKAARHWAIYQLGVAKFGWNLDRDIPTVKILRPQRVILDPDSTIDEDGYTGERIGEYRKLTASKILSLIGDKAPEAGSEEGPSSARRAIDEVAKDNLATEVQFQEWWTPTYMCWVLGKTVLLKKKNPHWNYDMPAVETQVDIYGNEMPGTEEQLGHNHFSSPDMPYSFLTVFNLGDQPMDKTSLISQNLANQDLINKRNRQITKNADGMNGGVVVSLARSGLTATQAKNVTEALRKGGVIVIPDGSPREAIDRYPAPALPPDIYNQLADTRARLRDIFGVKGSSQAGLEGEDTVRGKIISRGLDTDRIGGGVTEYLEQFADDIYNWFLQLLYVYDTGFQFVPETVPPKIIVSVKEGSLLPKDSTTIANQALELAKLNRISTLDLFKRLEYPNPEELAANVWLEQNAPHILYKNNPLVQEVILQQQMAAQAQGEAEVAARDQETANQTNESAQSHQQNLETEALKGQMKLREGAQKSLLSQVPTK